MKKSLSAFLIFVLSSTLTAKSALALGLGCDYSEKQPCPKMFKDYTSPPSKNPSEAMSSSMDTASIAASFCYQIKANDKACSWEFYMASAYAVIAAVCTAACFTDWISAGTGAAACHLSTAGLMVAEYIENTRVRRETKKYTEEAKTMIAKEWGVGFNEAEMLFSALNSAGSVGIGLLVKGKEVKGTTDGASCVSAVLNGTMAIMKGIDWHQIGSNSSENYEKVLSLVGQQGPGLSGAPVNAPVGGGINGAPPQSLDVRTPFTLADRGAVDKAAATNQLGESFAKGALRNVLKDPSPSTFKKAAEELANKTGVTPGALMESVANNGLAATLGKFANGNQDFINALNAIERQAKGSVLASSEVDFSSPAGGGGRSNKPSGGDLFGRKTSSIEGGKGVSEQKFGGFNGDIWHAGTNKSIFEIVSEKTHSVSSRINP